LYDGGETINDELGDRPIVIEFKSHYSDVSDQTAIILGDYKLIHYLSTGEYELYDLSTDPDERWNLAAEDGERREELAALLAGIIRDHQGGFYAEPPSPLEAQRVQEELRALGYIQ
jgi:arylsulfatase A-like enzyme